MAVIIGTPGADSRNGTDLADTIRTVGGNDAAFGGAGDDRIEGGAGDDNPLSGEEGRDIILGGTGNDTLSGGPDVDSLRGEEDADTLVGGRDNDALQGGPGRDVFSLSPGDGEDTINDFAKGQDTITLAGFDNFQTFEQLQIQVAGADSLIILAENEGIRVRNQTNLDAGDFLFEEVTSQVNAVLVDQIIEQPIANVSNDVRDMTDVASDMLMF